MKFSMKKVTVLLADGFEEIEALTVVDLLQKSTKCMWIQYQLQMIIQCAEHMVIPVQTEDLIDRD